MEKEGDMKGSSGDVISRAELHVGGERGKGGGNMQEGDTKC